MAALCSSGSEMTQSDQLCLACSGSPDCTWHRFANTSCCENGYLEPKISHLLKVIVYCFCRNSRFGCWLHFEGKIRSGPLLGNLGLVKGWHLSEILPRLNSNLVSCH